MNSDDVN
ncbi:Protein of unknown function [Bacillus cytotoxicus]|nr:Protein of unknown function [Bacillus cytotoxicus]SCN35836.1 Protein of unknown function [Bacillus cytotoxicus]